MQSSSEQPLVGEEHCVTTLKAAAKETGGLTVPGACFSKVSKLFGRISGDIILFVSSKRRRLEARNFAVIFIFIPFTTY